MSDRMRMRGVAHGGCALALAALAGLAHAEREPAALARARARAEVQAGTESGAESEAAEAEADVGVGSAGVEELPPDAEDEVEGGGDVAPEDRSTQTAVPADPNDEQDEAESVRDAASRGADSGRRAPRSGRGSGRRSAATALGRAPAPAPTRVLAPPSPAAPEPPGFEHVVAERETLGAIAARYQLTVQALLEQNPGLDADRIRAGQHIVIDPDRKLLEYTVQPGDTLIGIARAQRVTIAELQRWNPKLNPERIRDGSVLRVFPRVPPSPSVSIGSPSAGRLLAGRKLNAGPGFAVRSSDRAWGTDETVRELVAGFASLQRAFPGTPRVWVHDISLRSGGPIDDHRSHQSGRDADIAYVQRDCGNGCNFHPLAASELDARRTWALLRYWLERDELEAVFVDYRLQAPLYRAARADGASEEELRRWFQYPRGRGNPWGIVRHYPKHGDHMHVRFACHSSDPECKTFRPLLTHTASR